MAKESNPAEKTLDLGGLSLGYSEAGGGSPIIVFPGQDEDSADPILMRLAQTHRVLSVHRSGPEDVSANRLAEKLPRALAKSGIERYTVMGVSIGARPALALAIAAAEAVDRLVLLSPLLILGEDEGRESLDLSAVKAATLVLVGTHDIPAAVATGRQCRARVPSCHLSFVYGAGHGLAGDRLEACMAPILQFLEEGEQFIIFRESQVIRS
jgi:pimeloyl-ACP methyl ester carboxylesterase